MPFGALRQPNNGNTLDSLMPIIRLLINVDPLTGLGNTVLAQLSSNGTGEERVYIEGKSTQTQSPYPSLLFATGLQTTVLAGGSQYETQSMLDVIYYNRWDRSPATIDAIHTNMRQDLERMQANLESNQGLVYQGALHAMAIPTIIIGSYDEELDEAVPSVALVKCPMTITINSLPYDA